MQSDLASEVRETVGDRFLAYVLNVEDAADAALTSDPSRQTALTLLSSIVGNVVGLPDAFQRRHSLVSMLFQQLPNGDESVTTQIRQGCGGSFEQYDGADGVAEALFYLARDLFPITLLPLEQDQERHQPWFAPDFAMTAVTFRHRWAVEFARRFLSDPGLGDLFPGHTLAAVDSATLPDGTPDEPFIRLQHVVSYVIWSDGAGGTLPLNSVADAMLTWMFALMSLRAASMDDLAKFADETVAKVRSLVAKHPVKLPLIGSLSNVDLEKERVSTSAATLIRWNGAPIERFVAAGTEAILWIDVEVRLLDILEFDPSTIGGDDDPTWKRHQHRNSTILASQRAMERDVIRARLAITLSSDLPTVYAPHMKLWTVPKPVSLSSGWYEGAAGRSSHPRSTIDAAGAERIATWTGRLQEFPESLWLGARRLLGATTERLDTLDAFIDAIICWENLLGTGEGEVTFRVSAALATLLQQDNPDRRVELYNEVRNLYGVRSGLVHGSREPDPADAIKFRDRAIELAIRAVRGVFDRPELRHAPSSSNRNRVVLLGA